MSLFQNQLTMRETRAVLEQALGKTKQNTGFSIKSKGVVPKTEVLGKQP
jgi:hypothetical protein